MNLPDRIVIREVGARDGLQGEAALSVDQRLELLDALLTAGLTHLEIAAFVSPKAVPAMAGAAELVAGLGAPEGVVRTALVPNLRGAEMALAAGIDELTVTISASAAYNQRNVHMTIEESVAAVAEVCSLAAGAGVPVDAVVSCAFGSPYEGDIAPAAVALLAEQLRASGAAAITLADTTGMATPRRIADVLALTGAAVGLHLHETRGTGLLNLYAGLQAGVVRFDTSVGGLGGSPFAAGAAGNVATEEAVALCDDLGVSTGIAIDRIIEAAMLVEQMVGHPVPSRVAHVGPRSRRT
ncbi:MAG: hydroxymethylglutaryl-CoA lyase [Actinomycetota bacterium]|nr:hydroxymethylglutaryl-CoA lyase [Actinomycetota bacterium]